MLHAELDVIEQIVDDEEVDELWKIVVEVLWCLDDAELDELLLLDILLIDLDLFAVLHDEQLLLRWFEMLNIVFILSLLIECSV